MALKADIIAKMEHELSLYRFEAGIKLKKKMLACPSHKMDYLKITIKENKHINRNNSLIILKVRKSVLCETIIIILIKKLIEITYI